IADKKLVSPAQLASANSVEFSIPRLDVTPFDASQNALKLVSEGLQQKHRLLPLYKRDNQLVDGVSRHTQPDALAEIQFHTNLAVEPILVDEEQIRRTFEQWQNANAQLEGGLDEDDEGLEGLEVSAGDEDGAGDSGVDDKGDDTPVVKFVNKVLVDA